MNHFLRTTNKSIFLLALTLVATLSACTTNSSYNRSPHNGPWQGPVGETNSTIIPDPATNGVTNQNVETKPEPQLQPKSIEAALLVPQTGKGAELGQALLNAAQLALFDMNPQNFRLIPKDTKGSPIDAQIAAQEAINEGADIILGPLFSQSVQSVANATSPYNVSVIGFTTDSKAATRNAYAMGFLPRTQVYQILDYAAQQQMQRFTIVIPNNQYGELIAKAASDKLRQDGLSAPHIHKITSNNLNLAQLQNDLMTHQSQAILLAVDLNTAATISKHFINYGLSNTRLQRLGLGLWDEAQNNRYSSSLEGAWYAAPNPVRRARFERIYKNTYGTTPPRLASMGYDATALAISISKYGGDFSRQSLARPNGFYGLDGIFRFNQNGLVERGLAILELSGGRTVVRLDAPQEFRN